MALKPTPLYRGILIVWGSVLLLFGAKWLVAPRARYVSSDPAPGATLAAAPTTVGVTFSEPLGDESGIDVIQTVTVSPSGEKAYPERRKLTTASGIDPRDTQRKTLRADLEPGLTSGRYYVNWRAYAARGNSLRNGSFYFAVGMTPPTRRSYEPPGELRERDFRQRGHRSALVGGIALILLGVILPALPRKG